MDGAEEKLCFPNNAVDDVREIFATARGGAAGEETRGGGRLVSSRGKTRGGRRTGRGGGVASSWGRTREVGATAGREGDRPGYCGAGLAVDTEDTGRQRGRRAGGGWGVGGGSYYALFSLLFHFPSDGGMEMKLKSLYGC